MATTTLNILPEGRTEENLRADAALVGGYIESINSKVEIDKVTIEDFESDLLTEAERDAYTYPDNVIDGTVKKLPYTQPDDTIMYKISYQTSTTTTIPNPEYLSEQDFGAIAVQRKFGALDSEMSGAANAIRAQEAYSNI